MATWIIRSRKRPFRISPPASFSWSGSPQSSKWQANGSHGYEKTPVYGQQAIRKGMHRPHERSATDLFRHDAPSWMTSFTCWTLTHVVRLRQPNGSHDGVHP